MKVMFNTISVLLVVAAAGILITIFIKGNTLLPEKSEVGVNEKTSNPTGSGETDGSSQAENPPLVVDTKSSETATKDMSEKTEPSQKQSDPETHSKKNNDKQPDKTSIATRTKLPSGEVTLDTIGLEAPPSQEELHQYHQRISKNILELENTLSRRY